MGYFRMVQFDGIKLCDCDCHKEGTEIMHFLSCCNFCYDKYLTKDGKVVPEQIYPLLRESHLESMTRRLKVLESKKDKVC